jgi:hypothetical protein
MNILTLELSGPGELMVSIPGSVAVKGLAESDRCLKDPGACGALEKLLVWVGLGSDRGSIQLAGCAVPRLYPLIPTTQAYPGDTAQGLL